MTLYITFNRLIASAFFCYEIERVTKKIKGDEKEKILLFLLFPEK